MPFCMQWHLFVSEGVCLCVSTIINTLPGTEGERLWVESHYDAAETVKFMS